MTGFKIDSGNETQRPFAFAVIVAGYKYLFEDGIMAAKMAGQNGVFYERLYTGGFVNRLQEIITSLRSERVKLQSENESLRHDLVKANDKIKELQRGNDTADSVAQSFYFGGRGGGKSWVKAAFEERGNIAALAERLAKVEDRLAPHGKGSAVAELHSRIDAVVERIGDRLNGLEALAEQRGERLDSLEERQHQDDLDRAAGEGMAERVPMEETLGQLSGIDGLDARLDAEARADEFPVVRPTHENGRQADTPPRLRVAINLGKDYGVGDWVKVGPCRSLGGTDIDAGWYEVCGVQPAGGVQPASVQLHMGANSGRTQRAYWVADRCVIDASPTKPGDL